MRVVVLDPGVIERVHPGERAELWRSALRDAGFLAEAEGPEPEAGALRAIRLYLTELDAAEFAIARARHPIEWLTGTVPPAVPLFMIGVLALTLIVGNLLWGDEGLLFGIAATPLVLGAFAVVGLAAAANFERQRRVLLALSTDARRRHAAELSGAVRDLAARTFVLRLGALQLVGAPHRTWLAHRLRDLRVGRPPVVSAEWEGLVADLNVAKEQVEEVLRGAHAGRPLESGALRCALPGLARRFGALGVKRAAEGAELAAALEAAAG
ncbi:hypothetical protein LBMAG42_23100 [Deltaproteobacteria bacterium]|nr:hypothetical protein LBMAG42_23100 [Deltaproteobacteria bacterium]